MQKEEILRGIEEGARVGVLSRSDVLGAFDRGASAGGSRRLGISEILYYIGGAIVFVGIGVLIWQHWNELNPASRILVTFGSGVASYFAGILFLRRETSAQVAVAFFLISALVTPLGLGVIFDNAEYNVGTAGVQSVISGIVLAAYLASYFVFRHNIFVIFDSIFGAWFFFAFTSWLVGSQPILWNNFNNYRFLVLGIAYMAFGYSFRTTSREPLSEAHYFFGLASFLGAALALGGWTPEQNIFWELIFPGLVFAAIFLSIPLKSRAFLGLGSLFLLMYIFKITAEYFQESLGWPLTLVIAGFALIGIGYLAFYLNKKYITA